MSDTDPDPRGLIREAYAISGITLPECRAIFLDWAMGVETGAERPAIHALLARHGAPAHPMTHVLRDGLEAAPAPARRGGASGRRRREEDR